MAENDREALATLARVCGESATGCPTLVRLDINMPVMCGIEFLEANRHLSWPQRQAIMILTTSVNHQDLNRVRQLPIAGILTKPLTEANVWDLLQTHFLPALG